MHDENASTGGDSGAMSPNIELRGVRVHNLKSIDVNIPLNKLTVITGVSGSGKSSLAFDTLYAEGQRRYIESFSSSARRHLDRLEKPDADSIARIPPAVALRQNAAAKTASRRSTIATVTEVDDLLRVLFSRVGAVVCPDCERPVEQDSAVSVVAMIDQLKSGLRLQIGFPLPASYGNGGSDDRANKTEQALTQTDLLESGFTRAVIFEGRVVDSSSDGADVVLSGRNESIQELPPKAGQGGEETFVIVDRLVAGKTSSERIVEAVETAFRESGGRCVVLVQSSAADEPVDSEKRSGEKSRRPFESALLDDDSWTLQRFSSNFDCSTCGREFVSPEPSTLSFRSPLGACPDCRGTGRVTQLDFKKMVPDESRSLRAGAIVALRGDRWKRERERLLRFAENAGVPLDVEFRSLTSEQREAVYLGRTSSRAAGASASEGLRGLFERLERRKQQTTTREFLAEWRQVESCGTCEGTRLRQDALAVRLGNSNGAGGDGGCSVSISDLSARTIDELLEFFRAKLNAPAEIQSVGANLVTDIVERLEFLTSAGLGYLQINREMGSLSRGEAQRVAMTSIAGSNLVNTLFVFDEPSAGLHPRDVSRVVSIIRSIRESGNTVVVVEHEPEFLNAADHVLDIGPAAGQDGGHVVYAGNPDGLASVEESATGRWLAGVKGENQVGSDDTQKTGSSRRSATGWLQLRNATCHNVQDCSVDIPLGSLCVVTGVSGAGKSSLIENVLFPAVCRELGQPCSIDHVGEFSELKGMDLVSSVELIDDQPLAGSRRSNPATWLKVFDEIRRLFAETEDARNRNLTASHFSFNTDSGGRCNKCDGTGRVEIDMQFLADVSMTCPDCNGTRYLPHILEVQWRARTIADVLAMTAAEAFSFFRGQPKIQKRLRSLKDVGLDYLTLGQPLATLSGGESQRLKLAACLASSSRTGSLLIMNEPTTGLHPADVARLLECFDGLLSVGHSLVVIEHNLDVIRHADHIIDLGPEAGPAGGRVVATGSVADIAACPESITGQYPGKSVPAE
ncbi:MAG: excinuclease ABC subunit UvrA [Planctomycetales bacterium]